MTDFEKAMTVIGTVGVVAAIARNSPYSYYRYYHYPHSPVVVVNQPPTVVVEQVPVLVETPVIIEREVVVEKPVYIETPGSAAISPDSTVQYVDPPLEEDMLPMLQLEPGEGFSPKLGGIFRIENMEIPGYRFSAAKLTSDPLEGSPLYELGLRKGDVVTRIGGTHIDAFDVLDQHEKEVEIRYIKADTERVLLAKVYIPTEEELWREAESELAP